MIFQGLFLTTSPSPQSLQAQFPLWPGQVDSQEKGKKKVFLSFVLTNDMDLYLRMAVAALTPPYGGIRKELICDRGTEWPMDECEGESSVTRPREGYKTGQHLLGCRYLPSMAQPTPGPPKPTRQAQVPDVHEVHKGVGSWVTEYQGWSSRWGGHQCPVHSMCGKDMENVHSGLLTDCL